MNHYSLFQNVICLVSILVFLWLITHRIWLLFHYLIIQSTLYLRLIQIFLTINPRNWCMITPFVRIYIIPKELENERKKNHFSTFGIFLSHHQQNSFLLPSSLAHKNSTNRAAYCGCWHLPRFIHESSEAMYNIFSHINCFPHLSGAMFSRRMFTWHENPFILECFRDLRWQLGWISYQQRLRRTIRKIPVYTGKESKSDWRNILKHHRTKGVFKCHGERPLRMWHWSANKWNGRLFWLFCNRCWKQTWSCSGGFKKTLQEYKLKCEIRPRVWLLFKKMASCKWIG